MKITESVIRVSQQASCKSSLSFPEGAFCANLRRKVGAYVVMLGRHLGRRSSCRGNLYEKSFVSFRFGLCRRMLHDADECYMESVNLELKPKSAALRR